LCKKLWNYSETFAATSIPKQLGKLNKIFVWNSFQVYRGLILIKQKTYMQIYHNLRQQLKIWYYRSKKSDILCSPYDGNQTYVLTQPSTCQPRPYESMHKHKLKVYDYHGPRYSPRNSVHECESNPAILAIHPASHKMGIDGQMSMGTLTCPNAPNPDS
jgi:hypothetical protein